MHVSFQMSYYSSTFAGASSPRPIFQVQSIVSKLLQTFTHSSSVGEAMQNVIRYDTIEEFNVDSKAECDQLNLAHAARNKKKLKQPNASAHLVRYRLRSVKAVQKWYCHSSSVHPSVYYTLSVNADGVFANGGVKYKLVINFFSDFWPISCCMSETARDCNYQT